MARTHGARVTLLVGLVATACRPAVPSAEPEPAPPGVAPIVEVAPTESEGDTIARVDPTPTRPSTPGNYACHLEVIEMAASAVGGTGHSTVSAAEADTRARDDACRSAGAPVEKCRDERAFIATSQNNSFSFTSSGGQQTTNYEKRIELREVVRRSIEREVSDESAVAACVAAHRAGCRTLFGTPECPRATTTYRMLD